MYIKENFKSLFPHIGYIDGRTQEESDYNTTFILNGVEYNLKDSIPFEISDVEVESLVLGSGLYLEASYVKYIKSYYLEEEDADVKAAWETYDYELQEYNKAVSEITVTKAIVEGKEKYTVVDNSETQAEILIIAYESLLSALDNAIRKYNIDHGLEVV